MKIGELCAQLHDEGFGDLLRETPDGLSLADFAIQREGRIFRVGQKERSWFCAIDLETDDEAEACACYLNGAMHSVWRLTQTGDESAIEQQQAILAKAGIKADRNDLPASLNLPDSRYRIFVAGSDLKRARQVLGLWRARNSAS